MRAKYILLEDAASGCTITIDGRRVGLLSKGTFTPTQLNYPSGPKAINTVDFGISVTVLQSILNGVSSHFVLQGDVYKSCVINLHTREVFVNGIKTGTLTEDLTSDKAFSSFVSYVTTCEIRSKESTPEVSPLEHIFQLLNALSSAEKAQLLTALQNP